MKEAKPLSSHQSPSRRFFILDKFTILYYHIFTIILVKGGTQMKDFVRRIDPMYYLLKGVILRKFLETDLEKEQKAFVGSNIDKHRPVFWASLVSGILVYLGLLRVDTENIDTIILSLLAPVMVMGGAWFAISFGGIPVKLIDTAMSITQWMFTAFLCSLTAMSVAVAFISPALLWPVIAIIYIAALFSCVQYDTADGLKAGLDEYVLQHSRYAIRYFEREEAKQ